MNKQLAKRQEMLETADNMIAVFYDIVTYSQLCIAEDYVKDFGLVYEGVKDAETMVGIMKIAIERRRGVVGLYNVPKPFDYRYNQQG